MTSLYLSGGSLHDEEWTPCNTVGGRKTSQSGLCHGPSQFCDEQFVHKPGPGPDWIVDQPFKISPGSPYVAQEGKDVTEFAKENEWFANSPWMQYLSTAIPLLALHVLAIQVSCTWHEWSRNIHIYFWRIGVFGYSELVIFPLSQALDINFYERSLARGLHLGSNKSAVENIDYK